MKIIGNFKQIQSFREPHSLKVPFLVVSGFRSRLYFFVAGSLFLTNLTGCSQVSLQKKVTHNLIANKSNNQENSPELNKAVNLNGLWKVGFRYQGKTGLGTMRLQQNSQTFIGSGKDDDTNASFKIDHGLIKGNEIIFLKRYDSSANQAVQYHGKFSYLSTENGEKPYMGGDYSVETNGSLAVGDWEAAQDEVKNVPVPVAADKQTEENNSQVAYHAASANHPADLSGKWTVAYEYNFKTIHSIMFLEQDNNRLTGHGYDLDSKEKFVIKKGWYSFPHVTLVRQYISGNESGRCVTFKADVSQVSDKDYSGPYLSGKTQGGGEWEAERVN